MNEPTIEAQPDWPAWAEWYAVDGDGEMWVYELRPDELPEQDEWFPQSQASFFREMGEGGPPRTDWRDSLRRIVRTPKEEPTKPGNFAIDAAQTLADRLATLGYASWARNVLTLYNIPVPVLVEREATGVDQPEGKQ